MRGTSKTATSDRSSHNVQSCFRFCNIAPRDTNKKQKIGQQRRQGMSSVPIATVLFALFRHRQLSRIEAWTVVCR